MKRIAYTEITDYLANRGIPKSFVANKLSFSRQYLVQVLTGKRNMPPELLDKINAVLGTNFKLLNPPPDLLPHEKLEADRQSLKEKSLWKNDKNTNI